MIIVFIRRGMIVRYETERVRSYFTNVLIVQSVIDRVMFVEWWRNFLITRDSSFTRYETNELRVARQRKIKCADVYESRV